MRRDGDGSWRLNVDDEARLLHTAIFVRDSCHLELPDTSFLPPLLAGDVPDRSAVLDPDLPAVAGEQWLSWWQDIVIFEAAKALGTLEVLEGPTGALDSHVIVDEHLLDWPTLDALASRPELRRAVQVSHDDAVRWQRSRDRRLRSLDPRARSLPHIPLSAIAESVMERLEVSPARVRAAVSILDAEGDWSALPVPGLLLVSASLAADEQRLVPLLDAAFISGVEAPAVPLPTRHRKVRQLPPSVIPEPVVLWEGPGASLTCERVIPYKDGFEIELGRHGLGPPPTPGSTAPRRRPNRQFSGLQVTLRYADGREELLDDVERDDREGLITVTTFGRPGYGDDTLWLWVMPLPPPGEVRLSIEWTTYGIEPVSVSFDGTTIRPEAPPD
jgi:hypothetical protein